MFRSKSGYTGVDIGRYHQPGSNGLTFDPDGRLTICQHGNRRVIRVNPHGDITVLADRYEGKRLNSPNDLVYRSDGTLFFTDPPFGLPGVSTTRQGARLQRRLPRARRRGLARHRRARGPERARVLARRALPLRRQLGPRAQRRHALRPRDAATGSRLLRHDRARAEDAIDGIKVDEAGNLYVCGPGGIWVLSPEGEHLGTLELPEEPHNLAWGDADGRTLYVTALTSVYRLRLDIPGIRPE